MSAFSVVREHFAPAGPRKPSAAITVESLESRCLMSGAPQIVLKPSNVVFDTGSYSSSIEWAAKNVLDTQTGPVHETQQNPNPPASSGFWIATNVGSKVPDYFVIDLGKAQSVSAFDLFNSHNIIYNNVGTAKFKITASNSLSSLTATVANGTVLVTGQLAPGFSAVDPVPAQHFTSSNTATFRYLRFDAITPVATAGGPNLVALNEIRVFGAAPTAIISGTVYNDTNAVGKLVPGEKGLAGVKMYIDAGNAGKYVTGDLTVTSDVNGHFSFPSVIPGTYRVREILPANYAVTAPTAGYFDVVVTNASKPGNLFFDAPATASISGRVFNDWNGDKIIDKGELGLGGWTVFIDLKGTGIYANGDPTAMTAPDGTWSFTGLTAGTYKVAVKPFSFASPTTPTELTIKLTVGGKSTGTLFGERAVGFTG
ncbi:MAG TPA: SdrD B-like domain-containing protein [Humisphaera sp.]|jgi:hypothetical protein|nr:SdrD B-like domain-containing protein [Humisphaera sp.]